jgi:hypothetical protein
LTPNALINTSDQTWIGMQRLRARIGVFPLGWKPDRAFVVHPEGAAQFAARLLLKGDAPPVLDHQESERLDKDAEDIGAFVIILDADL